MLLRTSGHLQVLHIHPTCSLCSWKGLRCKLLHLSLLPGVLLFRVTHLQPADKNTAEQSILSRKSAGGR